MRVAVVIPCYRVRHHVLDLLAKIGPTVEGIFVIDDACPEGSGELVARECKDARVTVIKNTVNLGVGGAVMNGYRAALDAGYDVIVKLDGDGQMDPALIEDFVGPIRRGDADYTKGNRFYFLDQLYKMPKIRIFGNAVLSLFTKLSSGYWNIFDPTNGYTAIHRSVAKHLPFEKISHRYFFESDMLFRLNTLRAVVIDVPMDAKYEDERSSLRIGSVIPEFMWKHGVNLFKRIFYNYYLRDMSLASIELPIGVLALFFGVAVGTKNWILSATTGVASTAGTVMLSALPIILGIHFILAFLAYDIASVPSKVVHSKN